MNEFHLLIIKDFNFRSLRAKRTPLLEGLVFRAQVSSLFILIMSIRGLLMEIVPLNRTVAVACDVILYCIGFPFETSTWVSGHAGCVADTYDFTLVNVVYSNLSVWTCCADVFVVCADFEWENFGVNVTEKVDETRFVCFVLFMIKFEDSRAEVFLFCIMCGMLEEVVPFF